jgi:hypothetical protein
MISFFKDCRTSGWRAALLGGTGLRGAGRLEGFLLRTLLAMVVWQSLELSVDSIQKYTSLPRPVGLAAWSGLWDWLGWDLTRLADANDPGFLAGCLLWTKVALAFYICGIGLPLALPVVTLVHIAVRTLSNSQGATHHGFQMVSMALLTQTLVVWVLAAARALGWWRARKRKPEVGTGSSPAPAFMAWAAPERRETWLWLYTIAIASVVYLTSVCSKISASDGKWLKNSPWLATEIVKTHRQNYYNKLDPVFIQGVPPAPADPPDPATDRYRHPVPESADWLSRHPGLARLIFGSGFFLEMFAFLALIDRRAALAVGMALVALHGSVEWIMELSFPLNQQVVALFFVNAPGWALLMARDPAWRPGWRLWLGSFGAAAALLGLHLATAGSESIAAHFLRLTQESAAVIPDLLGFPPALKWPAVLAVQTVLFAALALSLKSLRLRELPGRFRDWRGRTSQTGPTCPTDNAG